MPAQPLCVWYLMYVNGESMEIQQVGIIGAGQMGGGIAHVFAIAGYEVLLHDVSFERTFHALQKIQMDMDEMISRSRLTEEEKVGSIGRIKTTIELADMSSVDLIIEAATEDEMVKNAIFNQLCPNLKNSTLLTTNTSSISITRLASQTDRPERFMGVHFMNPVPKMKLVELIRGIATEDETYQILHGVIKRLNKETAYSEDFPGFIVNRILMPMINEAVYALYEGVGSVNSIDRSMRLGANHPMGPFELADFIGLDVCLAIMNVLHEGLADTKYRPCPLLTKYVDAGWLGRKTKRGFYNYHEDPPVATR